MIAAAFAGYAVGVFLALVRVVLRYPPWKKYVVPAPLRCSPMR
jgi:hypothetical protein